MQPQIAARQRALPGLCPITTAVEVLSNAGGIEERGAIFTRREVVDFILDLIGYRTDLPLYKLRLLEPSFGNGDFLLPAIDRLLAAWKAAAMPLAQEALGSMDGARRFSVDRPARYLRCRGRKPALRTAGNDPQRPSGRVPQQIYHDLRPGRLVHSVHRALPAPALERRRARLHLRRPLDEKPLRWTAARIDRERVPPEGPCRYDRHTSLPLRRDRLSGHYGHQPGEGRDNAPGTSAQDRRPRPEQPGSPTDDA